LATSVLGIDTGGTFTDFVLVEEGRVSVHKLPSEAGAPARVAADGLARLGVAQGADVALGTTVATNALLERRGARTALVTTAGFEDVLQLGRQARFDLYALEYVPPEPLVPSDMRIGVRERVGADGAVLEHLSAQELRRVVREVRDRGVDAVAVCLLFSFLNPTHERQVAAALRHALPGCFVTASADVLPEFREFERTSTVAVNAYVGPLVAGYLRAMQEAVGRPVRVMQSSGGSITADLASLQPVRTVLSGPAGGVIGARSVASAAGYEQIITLDMGGTSTDVSVCPGRVLTGRDHVVDSMPVGVPLIDIRTVGAGGGSLARLDVGGALRVGPESAGASPGPACYGVGSEPTVTDANLLLGRVPPDGLLGGRVRLDTERAASALTSVASGMGADLQEAALGVVRVANAIMERALRNVSLEQGYDPREFTLVAFGGAGPQHACALAASLGMPQVLVPPSPGVLSALGVAIADVSRDLSRTVMVTGKAGMHAVAEALDSLEAAGMEEMTAEGFPGGSLAIDRWLDARYAGQSFELAVAWPSEASYDAVTAAFHNEHERRFGYSDPGGVVEIVTARLRLTAPAEIPEPRWERVVTAVAEPEGSTEVWFDDGAVEAALYRRERLRPGDWLTGPALVVQMDATTVVPPGWRGEVDAIRNLILIPEAS
jgi:N-methylhydantoinase A